jgi:hypothetical protein
MNVKNGRIGEAEAGLKDVGAEEIQATGDL